MSEPEPRSEADPGLTDVEAALGGLSPSRSRIDRDRLMDLAGRARSRAGRRSSAPSRWAWPAVAAGLGALALGEAVLLARRPEPEVIERVVVVREPIPPATPVVEAPPTPTPAPTPGPAEPVILVDRDRPGASPLPSWAWPPIGRPRPPDDSPAGVRRRVMRLGLEGLPEPPPLAMLPDDGPPGSAAARRRAEIESLLNFGGSS